MTTPNHETVHACAADALRWTKDSRSGVPGKRAMFELWNCPCGRTIVWETAGAAPRQISIVLESAQ